MTAHLIKRRCRKGVRIHRSEVKAHVAAALSTAPQTFAQLARSAPILALCESFARDALRRLAVETYESNGRELTIMYARKPAHDRAARI